MARDPHFPSPRSFVKTFFGKEKVSDSPHINRVVPRNAARDVIPYSEGNRKTEPHICPQTPMGSWRVNAILVLLSTSRLYTG
jgi:hypothetical protein